YRLQQDRRADGSYAVRDPAGRPQRAVAHSGQTSLIAIGASVIGPDGLLSKRPECGKKGPSRDRHPPRPEVAALPIAEQTKWGRSRARDPAPGSNRPARSGGIIFERNSVGSLVYPPGGAVDEKFYHAT